MKEHPITMTAESVRAILADTKTQTRRVIKPQPKIEIAEYNPHVRFGVDWSSHFFKTVSDFIALKCPYGVRGDTLWVRETWLEDRIPGLPKDIHGHIHYQATGIPVINKSFDGQWRPSIFMPRWASRLTLKVVNVRVERVQDISESDAKAEGVIPSLDDFDHDALHSDYDGEWAYRNAFESLWNSINAKRGYAWNSNPWVWVIEFKRIKPMEK